MSKCSQLRDKTDFENGFQLELMTSSALTGKAPAGFNWAAFYKTFRRSIMTPREMAIHIWRGHSFTPVWENARREENFISAGHLALDFDAGDETSSLDHLMRVGTFAWMFASFAYSTPSSTPDAPRSRLVFILEYPIYDPGEYRAVYQAVAWWIGRDGSRTDPACKDPLRLYYGSPGCDVRPNWSVLGAATIEYVLDEYRAAHPPALPVTDSRAVVVDPTPGMKDGKLAQIGRAVNTAPKGERHNTLLKMARLGGGYIAGGVLDETAVINELTAASRGWGDDEREIERVIRDGIANGKGQPLQMKQARPLTEMWQ